MLRKSPVARNFAHNRTTLTHKYSRLQKLPWYMTKHSTSVSLHSNCIQVDWIVSLMLTRLFFSYVWCPKLFGDVMTSYTALDSELNV